MAIVAIVGKPNVGKSTLFNRITSTRAAVTAKEAGTTRDRVIGQTTWRAKTFTLVDMAGIETVKSAPQLSAQMQAQIKIALKDADLLVLVLDGSAGLTPGDQEAVTKIRKSGKPTIIAINKSDSKQKGDLSDIKLKSPSVKISAAHGSGVGDLLDHIVKLLPEEDPVEEREVTRLAIVGRPNVGKSSVLNRLVGHDRAVVSDIAGTTRDAITEKIKFDENVYELIDTAGLRKSGKREPGIEKFSSLRSFEAINQADIVAVVIATDEGVTAQDIHIIGYAKQANKGLIILVNKSDLADEAIAKLSSLLKRKLNFAPYALYLFVSAKTGRGFDLLPQALHTVKTSRELRISTGKLNRIIGDATTAKPPAGKKGKQPKIFYATQAEVKPPTFILFARHADLIHFSYLRYIENQIRAAVPFDGTAISIKIRERSSR